MLYKLYKKYIKSSEKLVRIFNTQYNKSSDVIRYLRPAISYSKEMCVVKLNDMWSKYCRNLIIISAVDKPRTITGTTVITSNVVKKYKDVMPFLRRKFNRKNILWEPKWHIAHEAIKAAHELSISNYQTISSAIGAQCSPADEIRIVRNYIVHQNKETARKYIGILINYNIPQNTAAVKMLEEFMILGVNLFEYWIRKLQIMARLSIN